MKVTTKAQRVALKRVYDRCPLYNNVISGPSNRDVVPSWIVDNYPHRYKVMTYKEFRKTAGMSYDTLMVKWCGMWLGIEPDGYTHS